MTQARAVLVIAVIAACVGGFAFIDAVTSFPFGTMAHPGPGFYSTVVSAAFVVTAIGAAVEALAFGESLPPVDWPDAAAAWRPLGLMATVIIGSWLLSRVGYRAAMPLMMLVILSMMDAGRWIRNVILAVVLGVGSYYLFVVLLKTPLPRGTWWS